MSHILLHGTLHATIFEAKGLEHSETTSGGGPKFLRKFNICSCCCCGYMSIFHRGIRNLMVELIGHDLQGCFQKMAPSVFRYDLLQIRHSSADKDTRWGFQTSRWTVCFMRGKIGDLFAVVFLLAFALGSGE
ncbi:hypothetical protein ACLOJK_020171 [Asimina triloba]